MYRVQESATDEDFHVLLNSVENTAPLSAANGTAYRADMTLTADGQWHFAYVDISQNLVAKYDHNSSLSYTSSWNNSTTIKTIWLGTEFGAAKTVDIAYACFFSNPADAEAFNTAYAHYISGDTYTDIQTVTTDLTPDEGTAIGYSIADGKYFNNNSSTASGTAIMNGTLSYAAESTNNPAYAEVISSANSGDTGYGFGARTLVWADNTNGISGSKLSVIAIRYRVADYVGGACDLGVLATRTKSSGTSISTTTAAPAGAKFAANTDGEWHTEYVLMGQSPYAQTTYKNYAGTSSYSYSTFGTSYTYYQLFVGQQWVTQNKIDYAYVLAFDSLASAQAYDAAFDNFYYQQNPATGTTVGTVNPTGLISSYGEYAGSLNGKQLSFTPQQFMNGTSSIYLTLRVCDAEYEGSTKMSDINYHHEVEMFQRITTVPASIVYYEDDFPAIDYATENTQASFTPGAASTGTQSADQSEAYGHDSTYEAGETQSSAGSDTLIESTGGMAFSFDFTGTGFEILSRIEAAASATLDIRIYDAEGELVDTFPVITEYDNNGDDAGGEQMYQVPVISYKELDYGDYSVEVWVVSRQDYDGWTIGYDTENSWVYYTDGTNYWKSVFNAETLETQYAKFLSAYIPGTAYTGSFGTASATSPAAKESVLHVDGIRIYNPLTTEDAARYYPANEANADIINVRDLIADGKMAFAELADGDLKFGTGAFTFVENRNNVLSDNTTELTGNEVTDISDYLRLGPNNEVWLNGIGKTQGVLLYVKPDGTTPASECTLQIGVHRVDEVAAKVSGSAAQNVSVRVACQNPDGSYGWKTLASGMTSGTEQYYRIDPTQSICDDMLGYLVLVTAENGLISLSSLKLKGYTLSEVTAGFSGNFAPWGDPEKISEQTENEKKFIQKVMKQVALFLTPDDNPSPEISGDSGEVLKIKSVYLKLDEDIDVIYTAQIPDGYDNPYMVFTYQGETCTVTDYTVNEQGLCCFEFSGVTPQCMGESMDAALYAEKDAVQYTDSVSGYSVRKYCENQLRRYKDDTKLVTLLSDLLTYGAAAQLYTGFRTDALVTDCLRICPSEYPGLTDRNIGFSGAAEEACDWRSASLTLSNALAVRFTFFAQSTDDLTVEVTLNGRTQRFTAEDFTETSAGTCYIEFRNISATEFDDEITASFYRGDTQIGRTIHYSVNTYICGMQDTDAAWLGQLLRALYNYGIAAKAYSLG